MTARGLAVAVQNPARATGVPPRAAVRRWVSAALGDARGTLTVRIVSAAESAELNARYRGRTKATNVLAFPAGVGFAELGVERPLGDIVVCAEVVTREAREQRKPLEAHWAHIVVHGALHLVGYDHETGAEARVMEARERALLAQFGFTDPYVPAR